MQSYFKGGGNESNRRALMANASNAYFKIIYSQSKASVILTCTTRMEII